MNHPLRLVKTNAEYRTLWTAETVLKFGGGLRSIAIPWLVMELTGDPLQLGVALALGTTPDVVLAPFIGYYIDRLPRRQLMVGAALAEAAIVALVPLAAAAGTLAPLHLYLVLVLLSITRATYHNAREATLPTIVADEDLDEANAHFYVAGTALSILFMLVGGALTQFVGGVPTLVGAAAATGLAVGPLAFVSAPGPDAEELDGPRAVVGDFVAEISAGLSVIEGTVVRDVVLFGIGINVASVPFSLLITTISWDVFGVALAYSVLLGSFTGGKLVGNYAVNEVPWSRERKYATGIVAVGVVALVVAALGHLVSGFPTTVQIGVLGASLFVLGGVEPLFNVPSDSLVQIAADDDNRGKVVMLTNAALQLPFPFALLGAGYLASTYSPFLVFGLSGGLLVLVGVVAAVRFGVVGSAPTELEATA